MKNIWPAQEMVQQHFYVAQFTHSIYALGELLCKCFHKSYNFQRSHTFNAIKAVWFQFRSLPILGQVVMAALIQIKSLTAFMGFDIH